MQQARSLLSVCRTFVLKATHGYQDCSFLFMNQKLIVKGLSFARSHSNPTLILSVFFLVAQVE